MTDEVDCIRATKMLSNSPMNVQQPDLVNCAERSILAKQQTENNCKGIFGDPIVCNKSGSFKNTSPLGRFNMFVEGQGGKLRKRSEPLKAVIRPKFVKSASIARLLGNNYSTATTNQNHQNKTTTHSQSGGGSGHEKKGADFAEDQPKASIVPGRRVDKFKKCDEDKDRIREEEEKETNSGSTVYEDRDRKVSFSSLGNSATADCAEEVSLRGSHLNLMSHNSDIRTLRAIRSLTKGLGKLLRRRTDSVDISPPDPEFKVSYLGNVLTGWAKGDGCFEKPLATLWRNYTQVQKPDVLMRIKVCPSGLKATTKQHGLTEYWSHRITHCASPKNYPRVFCWIYRHEGRKMKHELRCHAVLCSKDVTAKDICSQLQGNLFRALKEFKRDKISRQNARLSLANCVYDNPSMPRRKLMLSVGGNNYRPPLERSKSAPKLMAIEEVEDDDEEREEEEYEKSRKRYVGSVGRRSWLNRNSVSVSGAGALEEDDDEDVPSVGGASDSSAAATSTSCDREGHDIDDTVQEQSFKLTPSISRFDDDDDDEDACEPLHRLGFDCDKETDGLEGEIMSYFEKKLNERSGTSSFATEEHPHERKFRNVVDTDEIISQLIRSQPPPMTRSPSANLVSDRQNLTPVAASESDEPESMRYQMCDDLESDTDSDHPRLSPSIESDDSIGGRLHYPGKGIQLAAQFSEESQLEMDLPKKRSALYPSANQAADSDSDVSDESGFIEYQDHKYPINSDINKADNSILV